MLSGKSAIVTGSTSGIGLGIARGLAASGANIMLNGFGDPRRDRGDPRRNRQRPQHQGDYSGANMADDADIADMIAEAEDAFGGVDILVNNAGIQHVAPIEEFPVEKWNAILAINLSSAFHTIRARRARNEEERAGAGSSISPRRMRWSPRLSSGPMSQPSTVSRA